MLRVKKIHPLWFLVLLVLITHGLMLFWRGSTGDGTICYTLERYHDIHTLYAWGLADGSPVSSVILHLIWMLPGESLKYSVIALSCLTISMLFFYLLLGELKVLTKGFIITLCLFFIVYPACIYTFARSITPWMIYHTLFFIAFYLGLRQERLSGWYAKLVRMLAAILFFVSFFYYSQLTVYLLFVMADYCIINEYKITLKRIASYCLSHLGFILLPIIFWVMKSMFLHPFAFYYRYNSFQWFSFSTAMGIFKHFMYYTFPVSVWFPFLVVGFYFFWLTSGKESSPDKQLRYRYGLIIAVGALLWFLGVVPYVAVGKLPRFTAVLPSVLSNHSLGEKSFLATLASLFETRYTVLASLGSAIIFVGFLYFFFADRLGRLKWVGKAVATICIGYFLFGWWQSYISWMGSEAARQSILLQLKNNPAWAKYSVFTILDRRTSPYFGAYYFSDWSGIFDQAYGGRSRAAALEGYCALWRTLAPESPIKYFSTKALFGISNINFKGAKSAFMVISPTYHGSIREVGLHYIFYRYVSPAKLDQYLLSISKLTVISDKIQYRCSRTDPKKDRFLVPTKGFVVKNKEKKK